MSPLQRIHTEKYFNGSNGPKKSESLPNCYTKLSQEPRYATQSLEMQNPIDVQSLEEQNESTIAMKSIENTPVTSKKGSKDELRKFMKMVRLEFKQELFANGQNGMQIDFSQITEMQLAKENDPKPRHSISSPPLECREVPRKHYLKKELSIMSEDSVMWQPASEVCLP